MDPSEQRLANQINQMVVQRVQSITVESLRTGNEFLVPKKTHTTKTRDNEERISFL